MLSARTLIKLRGLETCATGEYKCRNLFKIILNSHDLWLQAYANIYVSSGSVTQGSDGTSLDGMSQKRIFKVVEALKNNEYFPVPSKRVNIPKANGKTRPIGIPSGIDKVVQEVWRIVLETIYEPVFSTDSYGFRPSRSCHTALSSIKNTWAGTKWFIEFDIKGFFDNINHNKLVEILEKKIDDRKFISVIKRMTKAGYMEDWVYYKTYTGTPQGGVVSPILANIYLNELDNYAKTLCFDYTKGKSRAKNKAYHRVSMAKSNLGKRIKQAKQNGDTEQYENIQRWKALDKQQRAMSSVDGYDLNYRRLRYCRYADDFVLSFIGSKDEAKTIAAKIESFIHEQLKLEVATEKSGVRHASTQGCKFLGYDINLRSTKKTLWLIRNGKKLKLRTMKDVVNFHIPKDKIRNFCIRNGYGNFHTQTPAHRPKLLNNSDVEIVLQFNAEIRGFAQYYALANQAKKELSAIVSIGRLSLLKTLADKHRSSSKKAMAYMKQATGVYAIKAHDKVYNVWTLKDLKVPSINSNPDHIPITAKYSARTELVQRMQAKQCEYCGTTEGQFEVHHVKKLKDIKDGKQGWQKHMIARNRKTLVLCTQCHKLLHAGKLGDNRHLKGFVESRVQ